MKKIQFHFIQQFAALREKLSSLEFRKCPRYEFSSFDIKKNSSIKHILT